MKDYKLHTCPLTYICVVDLNWVRVAYRQFWPQEIENVASTFLKVVLYTCLSTSSVYKCFKRLYIVWTWKYVQWSTEYMYIVTIGRNRIVCPCYFLWFTMNIAEYSIRRNAFFYMQKCIFICRREKERLLKCFSWFTNSFATKNQFRLIDITTRCE